MTDCTNTADRIVDLMKLARDQWVTRQHVVAELEWDANTASRWTMRLESQGLLISRARLHQPGARRSTGREYTLAPEWGGVAK